MNEEPAKKGFQHHPHFWLCVILTIGEFALLYIMFFVGIPDVNKEIAYTMSGVYSSEWASSVKYWYSTTFGSNNKTDALMKAEPIKGV